MEKNANLPTIIIDSSSLAHRVKHTLKNIRTEFEDTGIIFGFLMKVLEISKKFNTNRFVFAFDGKKENYLRKKIYPGYKTKPLNDISEEEKRLNETCYKQLYLLGKEVLPQIGFQNIYKKKGYEADDIIANIVKNNTSHDFIIHSNDKDLYQLLDYSKLYKANKKVYTKIDFINDYNIHPKMWPKVKAIAGCKSDRIPGVYGIGEKKAILYLKKKCSQTIKEKIESEKDNIKLYEKLTHLPLNGMKPIYLKYGEILDLSGFIDVCTRFSFHSFMDNGQLEVWTAYLELNNKIYTDCPF